MNQMSKEPINELSLENSDRIIEMAWEDRTPFEAIKLQFGLSESDVIKLMRTKLKRSSFNRWRKRVNSGVSQKHLKKRSDEVNRFKCSRQKTISMNKISKRKGNNGRRKN
jgi:uncharacterized protein (TIGR03643 family)